MTALYLLLVLGVMGAADTLWYHEYQQQLPRNASARIELRLHAARDFFYTIVFGSLAWGQWQGMLAWAFLAVLAAEIIITLWDFIEEDLSRRLPAGERIMHTIMAIVYGGFLANLLPQVFSALNQPTGFAWMNHGVLAWILTLFAGGVFLSGVRDVVASFKLAPKAGAPARTA